MSIICNVLSLFIALRISPFFRIPLPSDYRPTKRSSPFFKTLARLRDGVGDSVLAFIDAHTAGAVNSCFLCSAPVLQLIHSDAFPYPELVDKEMNEAKKITRQASLSGSNSIAFGSSESILGTDSKVDKDEPLIFEEAPGDQSFPHKGLFGPSQGPVMMIDVKSPDPFVFTEDGVLTLSN